MQTRKEFLKNLGLSGAAIVATYCFGLSSCSKESVSPATNVDFTIDLNDAAYAALKNKGGYIVKNSVVIAYTTAGTYVAVTQVCSHEGEKRVTYTANNNFYCSAHGALFDINGKGLNSEGSKGLKVYQTQLTNTTLRIFG